MRAFLMLWMLVVTLTWSVLAQGGDRVNFSPLFIDLSDAMTKTNAHDVAGAKAELVQVETAFGVIKNDRPSVLADDVWSALQVAKTDPNPDHLKALSVALYAYEKEQNPVDYTQKREQFRRKVMPAYDNLAQAITALDPKDISSVQTARQSYDVFNRTWVANERVVRSTSMGHYGKIETAMALIRFALASNPPKPNQLTEQLAVLKDNLDSYNQGTTEDAPSDSYTLADGIALLEQAKSSFVGGDVQTGQARMAQFISIWVMIEGEVSTRDGELYTRIESQSPIIMAHGDNAEHQKTLQTLIDDLKTINPDAAYGWMDAFFILLREGLEAMLIVVALICALRAAAKASTQSDGSISQVATPQRRGMVAVWAGVAAGLVGSLVGAYVLLALFPAMTSGANREMLEGYVGIVAVGFMIGIGAWLHSKSNTAAWNAYIKRHTDKALGTGSLVGLFGLAFLAVLREGAETILFYVGILGNISLSDFWFGIGAAVLLLLVIAVIMLKTSVKLPIPLLFRGLTLVIYALGFKILGVSISALQLTGVLERTVLDLPTWPSVGFYPTVQGIVVQVLYVAVIVLVSRVTKTPRQ